MKKIVFVPGVTFHIPKIINSTKHLYHIKVLSTVGKSQFNLNKENEHTLIPMFFKILSRIFNYNNFAIEKIIDNLIFRHFSKFSKIKKDDIIYGCSSYALNIFCKNKENLKILDVANIHVDDSISLLKKEYEKFGLKFKYSNYLRNIQIKEYNLADKIIVPSSRSLKSFLNNNVAKDKLIKTFFISNYKKIKFKKKFKEDNNIVLGYIGGNVIIKGLYYLLKAVKNNSNKNISLNLCIPKRYINLHHFLKRNYDDNLMSCKGFTNQMDEFYSKIDYLVVPSISDGFAQVVLESLERNIPVICSDAVGSSEYINDNFGYIFKSQSAENLTEILNKISLTDLNSKIKTISNNFITLKNKIENENKNLFQVLNKN
tara:strand:- start:1114 stop:2229 length:1116 start_codon:yes stop_codon:yes gene_type:complete